VTTFTHLLEADWPFSVQTRVLGKLPHKPYDINKPLSDRLSAASGAPLDVRAPFQILSVVLADDKAYLGLSLATNNLSDWAGGVRRFAREAKQISRAEFKLLEALEAFKIELPPRGRALDLGAAPGGWTRVLRQKEQYVTAVDPAWLHPSLQTDKNVRHLRLTAEEYLKDDPDRYDVIINDMRLDARDSARLMVAYGRYLYPHGLAIITLKLPEKNYQPALDHALNILRRAYTIAGAKQLFHNRSEVTVYLKPKGK
ncbi:MAG: 50S rRNA methyltransferase, partial [Chloroflexi bacterium]|nr:50S rRNA methyltransferase [Chloroflexota bacterium]